MIEFISQSMMNQWFRCPESFRRRWIEGDIIPPGIAARIGTGLHKGAEVNHRAKVITGEDEPLSIIQDAARDCYVKTVRNEGVFFPPDELSSARKQLLEGIDTTVALAKLYRESFAPKVLPYLIEERLTLDRPGLPIPFAGTIDLLTNDNWLPDIKSAEKKWPSGKADTEIQATLYRELVRERTGSYPNKISFEVFTKSKLEHHSFETTRTPEDFELLVRAAAAILKSIQAGIFHPAQPGAWNCGAKWCGYWWTCPWVPEHRKIIPKG